MSQYNFSASEKFGKRIGFTLAHLSQHGNSFMKGLANEGETINRENIRRNYDNFDQNLGGIIETNTCSHSKPEKPLDSDESSPMPVTLMALETPENEEEELETVPSQVPLLSIYTRPVFPGVCIRAITKQTISHIDELAVGTPSSQRVFGKSIPEDSPYGSFHLNHNSIHNKEDSSNKSSNNDDKSDRITVKHDHRNTEDNSNPVTPINAKPSVHSTPQLQNILDRESSKVKPRLGSVKETISTGIISQSSTTLETNKKASTKKTPHSDTETRNTLRNSKEVKTSKTLMKTKASSGTPISISSAPIVFPTIITEKGFVETIVHLHEQGEQYVVLSLVRESKELHKANLANGSHQHAQRTLTTSPNSVFAGSNNIEGICAVGVLARIDSIEISQSSAEDLSSTTEVILTGLHRIVITGISRLLSVGGYLPIVKVSFRIVKDQCYNKDSQVIRALVFAIESALDELAHLEHPLFKDPNVIHAYRISQRTPSQLADLCGALITASPERLQQLLTEIDVIEKLKQALLLLKMEIDLSRIVYMHNSAENQNDQTNENQNNADTSTGSSSSSNGPSIRSGTLRSGNFPGLKRNDKWLAEFRQKIKDLSIPQHAQTVINEEMSRLSSLDPLLNATEHYTCRNYLNWLVSVPWGVCSKDNFDLDQASKILDDEHYGLKDAKERILEFIAVGSLKGNLTGRILCFVGPPGVGKTSLGKSVAHATERKFFRFSVGGMSDVAEIKGHRRTYIGALPGKLIQSLKHTKTMNPVILIDEIDKLSKNWNGDPASALLEVLDPEQNYQFLDYYLDLSVDLSKVLFLCTANTTDTIPRPLLDRMEVIHLPGYYLEEKMCIARRHLIPNLRSNTGLKEAQITIDDKSLHMLIDDHCREAGVRNLQKNLEKIFRKVAHKIARKELDSVSVTTENLQQFVGKPMFHSDQLYLELPPPGVVAGLAWNSFGGSLIWIEAVHCGEEITGSKSSLTTTGHLGEVMKESIQIALTFAKKFSLTLKADDGFFERTNIHIHFPEGATPKDGPSAGCAIVTALLSLFLKKSVPSDLAMTGEITLTGLVLPVGGIQEKTMAAKRSSMKRLLLPEANRSDFEELPLPLKEDITVIFANRYQKVFDVCFSVNARL